MSQNSTAVRLSYLVYLAGVEVPCVDVNIQCGKGQDSSASITLAPHSILAEFGQGDKVQAAIFYLDSWYHSKSPTWCLLYEGYVSSIQYAYSALRRQVVLNIKPNIAALSNLYLEFLGGEAASGKISTKANKSIPNQITLKGKFPGRLFTVGMADKEKIRTPYEFYQNIILATTGKYKDKDIAPDGTKKEVNLEVKRLRELYTLNYQTRLSEFATDEDKNRFISEEADKIRSSLRGYGVSFLESDDNVTLQGKLIEYSVKEILKERSLNDRTPVATGFFARFCNLTKLHRQVVASPIIEGFIEGSVEDKYKTKGMPSGVFPILRTRNGKMYSKGLAQQTGYKYGDNGSALSLLNNMFTVFNYSMQQVLAPPAYCIDANGLPKAKFSKSSESVIAGYITKPDSNYSLPPACNVIFPCLKISMQTSTVYDERPTRVYYNKISQLRKLNTEQKLGTGYASMDSQVGFPAAIAQHAIEATDTYKSGLEVLVFPEEYYSGPRTVYKELDPMLAELDKIEKSGRLKETTGNLKSDSYVDYGSIPATDAAFLRQAFIKSDKKGNNSYEIFLRQAQIDYEDMRASSSNCTVSIPFNPYLVVGYSCLVLDSEDVNNHLIGTVTSISHVLTQQSSNTTVTLSGVRSMSAMLKQVLLDGGKYQMSPAEPLTEIRSVLQDKYAANFYYANLLYRDSQETIKIGNAEKLRAMVNSILELTAKVDESSDSISQDEYERSYAELEKKKEEYLALLEKEKTNDDVVIKAVADYTKLLSIRNHYTQERTPISVKAANNVKLLEQLNIGELVIHENAKELANNYSYAMDYCSRPVCTLEQYIDFYASQSDLITSSVTGGRGKGCRIGIQTLDNHADSAVYYKIIREFVGGPGIEPG